MKLVTLPPGLLHYAIQVGESRHRSGSPSRTPDSGFAPIRVDLTGAVAEVAVCLFYGEDPSRWVVAHDARPGAIPDLIHAGYKVSVKGRERWDKPLDLIVPEHDVHNDIYVLVSVVLEHGVCGLRGWIPRRDLLTYPVQPWKWTTDRPGATTNAGRRYIPVDDLKACR